MLDRSRAVDLKSVHECGKIFRKGTVKRPHKSYIARYGYTASPVSCEAFFLLSGINRLAPATNQERVDANPERVTGFLYRLLGSFACLDFDKSRPFGFLLTFPAFNFQGAVKGKERRKMPKIQNNQKELNQ